jgi:regulatory protein
MRSAELTTEPAVKEQGPEEPGKQLKRARNSAYRYLTIRPRSRVELEKKLRDREFPPDVVTSVIDHCVRLGYLDDARFAALWAASRVRVRGYGRRRIEQELRTKGIGREIIRHALDEAVPPEHERAAAEKAAERKLRTLRTFDPEVRKRRLAGFLERKGFPSAIIHTILHALTKQ